MPVIVGRLWVWSREGLLALVGLLARTNTSDADVRTDYRARFQYVAVFCLSVVLVKLTPAPH